MKDTVIRISWKLCFFAILIIGLLVTPEVSLAQDTTLEIHLKSPSAGETYYAAPSSLCYTINIKGWIQTSQYEFGDIQIVLQFIQDDEIIDTIKTTPDIYGEFLIPITVNPAGSDGLFTPVEVELNCADCHYRVVDSMPTGDFSVRVSAIAPDGTTVSDERHVRVDLSDYATLPVEVVLAGEPDVILKDIPVTASTWIYLWRTRVIRGMTNDTGIAELQVESLSLVPTEYEVTVEPAIVDGYLYKGTGKVEVTLEPGADSAPMISVEVTRTAGQIMGHLTSSGSPLSLDTPLWLVHLPDASAFELDVVGGRFLLPDVPLDKYLITADAGTLAQNGYSLKNQQIDLKQSIEADLEIKLSEIQPGSLLAKIVDKQNTLLPFSWLTVKENGMVYQTPPGADSLVVYDLSDENQTVIASAPGYYSRAAVLRPDDAESNELQLVINPDTQVLPWGTGSIILPPESGFEVKGNDIQLDRGWVWGEGGGGTPVYIHIQGADITINDGKFAIENVPGKSPWIYLWSGTATVYSSFSGRTTTVGENQMVTVPEREYLVPVTMTPVVTAAMHAYTGRPFDHVWQPGLSAQIRDRLAMIGIGTAQLVTLITYLLGFLSIILVPAYLVYSSHRKRRLQTQTASSS